MKQTEKYIYIIIIVILVAIIASGATYMVMKNKEDNKVNESSTPNKQQDNNQKNDEEQISDGVKQKRVYSLGDKIVEELEITLNGKTKIMKVTYSYEYDEDILAHIVRGKYNNIELYNNELRDDEENSSAKKDVYNIENIKNAFNEDNYKIIEGKDNKNYLAFLAYARVEASSFYNAYIFNEDLELISKNSITHSYNDSIDFIENTKYDYFNVVNDYQNIVVKANGVSWYSGNYCEESNAEGCHVIFKIEDNKIYFLALKLKEDYSENDYGVLEERVYTINNNKLSYEVIKEYKVTEMEGLF